MKFPITLSVATAAKLLNTSRREIRRRLYDGSFPRSDHSGKLTTCVDVRDIDMLLGEQKRGLALWRAFLLLTELSTHARDYYHIDDVEHLDAARINIINARINPYHKYDYFIQEMFKHLGQINNAHIKERLEQDLKKALSLCN